MKFACRLSLILLFSFAIFLCVANATDGWFWETLRAPENDNVVTECRWSKKCKTHADCDGTNDLYGPRCLGAYVQKCQCNKCLRSHLSRCSSDRQCGGMLGACNQDKKKCDCFQAAYAYMNSTAAVSGKKPPLNSLMAWINFCTAEVNPAEGLCLGLGTGQGICICPPKI